MTSYPPGVKYYRKELETRRLKPRNLYEVLSRDVVENDPSSIRRMKEGVYNLGKPHWGLCCDNITFTFVWAVEKNEESSETAYVTGGTCISYFESPEDEDISPIGQTGLSIQDIERAGSLLFSAFYLISRELALSIRSVSPCSVEIPLTVH